jgi:rare lipoprotein A (peptidoglycan hydrolase)
MMALGAPSLATSIAVPMATAQSGATVARAADIASHRSTLNVMAGRRATVAGHVSPAVTGRHVALQRRGAKGRWNTIDHATTTAGGPFAFRIRPRQPGSARMRLAVDSARRDIGRLNAYRRAAVSWYGPGLYGNKLSCGGTLTPGTLGVANKALPCGSRVTLRRGHRVVRVPVVDRGPYVAGREFDLTAATREKLHFGGAGEVLVAA